MRFIVALVLCFFTFPAFAQDSKKAEKERLKQPAQVTIAALPETVKTLLVAECVKKGWQLTQEGGFRLVFQRDPEGIRQRMGMRMAYGGSAGNPPRYQFSATITAIGKETLIVADLSVVTQRPNGTSEHFSWNRDKRARAELEDFLARIRTAAESTATGDVAPLAEAPAVVAPVEAKPSPVRVEPQPTPMPAAKKCYENGRKVPCPQ